MDDDDDEAWEAAFDEAEADAKTKALEDGEIADHEPPEKELDGQNGAASRQFSWTTKHVKERAPRGEKRRERGERHEGARGATTEDEQAGQGKAGLRGERAEGGSSAGGEKQAVTRRGAPPSSQLATEAPSSSQLATRDSTSVDEDRLVIDLVSEWNRTDAPDAPKTRAAAAQAMAAEALAASAESQSDLGKRGRTEAVLQSATKHGRLEAGIATRRPLSPITAPLDPDLDAKLQAEGTERFLRPRPAR